MKPQLSIFNYSIVNQSDDVVDIFVDGEIVDSPTQELYKEWFGDETSVSFKSLRDKIPANCKTINLTVNSTGGHVGDAMAIHDYLADLENKGVTVNRKGTGIVASAATYLVMGKNSSLSKNCLFLIHEVSSYCGGNVTEMENFVKSMRKFNDVIVDFYSEQTGLSKTVIGNMMKAETWMTATECKEKGFVKNISGEAKITNSIKKEQWPFNNQAMFNTYNSFISNNNDTMDTTKITEAITNGFNAMIEKLGLTNKKDDQTVVDAFKGFSDSITNTIKDIVVPDNEAIGAMVNAAIVEALKEVPESFKNAITEATKNSITKEDLKTQMETLTNSLVEKLGGKADPKLDNKLDNKKKANGPGNRFRGVQVWSEE